MRSHIKNLFHVGAHAAFAPIALGVVILVSTSLMLFAAWTDSATSDEPPHIAAGYGYIHERDSRLNPEHPPLIKALSALPLVFIDPFFPSDAPEWENGEEKQWEIGRIFLYESGNDPHQLLFLARLIPILITLLVTLLIFFVARRLFGSTWALFPTTLFALSPTVLAHGHYVATDLPGAFGVLLAITLFVKALQEPSQKRLIIAGLAFGLAQAIKFSSILLIPFFLVLAGAWAVIASPSTRKEYRSALAFFSKSLTTTVCVFLIGYALVIYPLYFLFTRNYPIEKQVSDTELSLQNVRGGPTKSGENCVPLRCVAEATIIAAGNDALRPFAQYALGIQEVQERIRSGNPKYFFGELTNDRIALYFPVVFSLKESIPALLFLMLAAFVSLGVFVRSAQEKNFAQRVSDSLQNHFLLYALGLFVYLYIIITLRSPLQLGVRHLLPIIPPLYILITAALRKWSVNERRIDVKNALIVVMIIWHISETILSAPYFLSYTNQLGGGVFGGYRYMSDSNYDWGQDVLRFRDWANEHLDGEKIAMDYFGSGNPEYFLPGQVIRWNSLMGDPRDFGIKWFASSIFSLEYALAHADPMYSHLYKHRTHDSYAWLLSLRPKENTTGGVPLPDYRVGTTIFIYKLEEGSRVKED
jgi:hypothetical protein